MPQQVFSKKIYLSLIIVKLPLLMLSTFQAVFGQGSAIKPVTIGSQVWMSENLYVKQFRNGDPILFAQTNEEWMKAAQNKQPAWCYFNNDSTTAKQHGLLYNWYAVNDRRGLAPQGWHIPSNNEWEKLFDFLGGKSVAGKKMKSKTGWANDGNGTNETGFSAYASGRRDKECIYKCQQVWGVWWSVTEASADLAWSIGIVYLSDGISVSDEHRKFEGLSVRCLKD